ncbi:hypothetical protein CERZMDRAFT_95311 [Cercospora zeae-maydis SCOH1-5]|uniref:DUF6590 domain-containing protein n=1 Tax=Cercospora zeae-maydis SCOH1-5 TaxID=717836 RepID=A0A6A6FNF0_9PEZI|nr:hypothetical protein CERZMDRAFT_95311 [Cercospora zeae-maydis SCOH1-5]
MPLQTPTGVAFSPTSLQVPAARAASKINDAAPARSKVQFAPGPARSPVAQPLRITTGVQEAMQRNAAESRRPGASLVSRAMGHVNVSGRLQPSIAPAPSYASVKTRFTLSRHPRDIVVSSGNKHPKKNQGWFDNNVCVLSPYYRNTFKQGDVISVPYHIPNLNPHVDVNQKELQISAQGPVFSKRRMMIVLWKGPEAMFCLPLFSWQQAGIEKKDNGRDSIKNYVCVVNHKDRKAFELSGRKTGPNNPLYFVHRHNEHPGLTSSTTCQLIGGHLVEYQEDIGRVGRIIQSSYQGLRAMWDARNAEYWEEVDAWPAEGEQDHLFGSLKNTKSRLGHQSLAPSRRGQAPSHRGLAPSRHSMVGDWRSRPY